MLRLSLVLTIPVMLFCTTFSAPFIRFLWGDRWTAAAPIFFWFSVGGVVAPIFTTTAWLFASEGRTHLQFRLTATTAAISVASFLAGIHWGAVGVVRANAISFVLIQTPLMIWGAARGGVVTVRDFAGAIVPLIPPAALATGALVVLAHYLAGWQTLIALGGGYVIFALAVLAMPGGRDLAMTTWRLAASLKPGSGKAADPVV
jgi:PST family polysaccharide transporter